MKRKVQSVEFRKADGALLAHSTGFLIYIGEQVYIGQAAKTKN